MTSVYTDIPFTCERRLTKQFDSTLGTKGGDLGAAIGITSPNSLRTPSLAAVGDAMGLSPNSGILNFYHDGASQNITVYEWGARRNARDSTKGWIKCGEGAAINTKAVDPESKASFKITPMVPYFIQAATTPIVNCWVHDKGSYALNPNTDLTDAA